MTPAENGGSVGRRAGALLIGGMVLATGARVQAQSTVQGAASPTPATSGAGAPQAAAAPATFDVNEFIVRGNTLLQNLDIEKAVYGFEGPGRTLKDVNAARDALQKIYQDKGYQSVVVELPRQQVKGGVIVLQVVETKVGRLHVDGAKYYSPQDIRDAVPALAEGSVPNFTQAQAQIAALNKSPDRQVIPTLQSGVQPQTLDVDLKVDDQSPAHGSVEVNNDSSPGTAELRTVASASYSNLWQLGHVLSASFLVAPQDTSDAEVYSLSYLAPFRNSNWSMMVSAYHSNSNVSSLGGTDVLGKGTSVGLSAIYALPSTQTYNQSVSVEVDHKHFDEDVSLGPKGSTAPLTYMPITLTYNAQLNHQNSQTSFAASVTTGIRGVGSDADAFDNKRYESASDFVYGKFSVTQLQLLPHDMQLSSRFSTQLANSPLVSSEEFSAGGINTVRGYLEAEDTADSGMIGSVEFSSPSIAKYVGSPVSEWRFHAFVDAAHLWLLSALPQQTASFNMLSTGIGTRATVFKYTSADLELGLPLKASVYTRQYDPRLDFYLRASF